MVSIEQQSSLYKTITDDIGTINIYRESITEDERKQRIDRFHQRLAEIIIADNQREANVRAE